MRYEFIAQLAREKAGLTAEHHMAGWHDLSVETEGAADVMQFEFRQAPLLTKGKNKGTPNWRESFDAKTVYISGEEIKQLTAEYVKRTGNCSECEGTTQVFQSWNHITGTKFRPCDKCGATGKAA